MRETAKLESRGRLKLLLVALWIGVPVLWFWLVSPIISKWVWESELSASGYAVVAKEYPSLSSSAQAVIAQKFAKGYLTGPDFEEVVTAMLKERESVQTSPAPDFGDTPESVNSQLWRRVTGEPTQSRAKDLLTQYTTSAEH